LVAFQLVSLSVSMIGVLMTGVGIEDCGCFGHLGWHETPLQVLIRDLVMLSLLGLVVNRQRDLWSLDAQVRYATETDLNPEKRG